MTKGKLLSLVLLTLIIFPFLTLVNPKVSVPDYSGSFVSQSLVQEMNNNQSASYLNQTTRVQIYSLITNNPGVNFRGICSSLALPIGVVQYHLAVLAKGELISNRRDGRNKRYFESKKFSSLEMKIISVLRHETVEKILRIVHDEEGVVHGKLAQRLDISSQALTWHMKKLKKDGIVTSLIDGMKVKYSIDKKHLATVKQCIDLISS